MITVHVDKNIYQKGMRETTLGECSEKFRKFGFPNVQYLNP